MDLRIIIILRIKSISKNSHNIIIRILILQLMIVLFYHRIIAITQAIHMAINMAINITISQTASTKIKEILIKAMNVIVLTDIHTIAK